MISQRRKQARDGAGAAVDSVAAIADQRLANIGKLLSAFDDWMTVWGGEPSRWLAFDQFIRAGLHDVVGAEAVRCFRLTVAGSALESLVPARGKLHALIPSSQGIFGTVLESGRAVIRSPEDAENRNEAVWCFPILDGGDRRGVISVGRMSPEGAADPALLSVLAEAISLLWNRLCDREQLAIARETDDRTGVLTRANFFRMAETALSESYAEREPAVLLTVALEGVRGLDDRGLWEQRDVLLTSVGTAIRTRLRSDDVVGRFSDDRFVALLRRMDLPLATMIAEKLMGAIRTLLADDALEALPAVARCCITGPAVGAHSLRELIAASLTAISDGRRAGLETIVSELRPDPSGPVRPDAVVAGGASREG